MSNLAHGDPPTVPESSRTRLALATTRPESDLEEPIAIVGAGCRFPGNIRSLKEFWDFIVEGKDAIEEVPPERWNKEEYYDHDPEAPGKMYTRWGGFLRDIDRFDPQFFDISPREAVEMDPQHRLLLEVAWEALETAGEPPERWSKGAVGVFVGHGPSEYKQFALYTGDTRQINAYNLLNNSSCFSAGRIAHAFGFQGPTVHVDTACSTSLVALDLAIRSLRAGECRMALAGGVNLTLTPEVTIGLSKIRALSRTGRCKTFSADADGYVRSEGCAVVVLKRLRDALAAGDDMLCVIRGSAVNHDGRSNGITAPNGEAQAKLYREALAKAGLTGGEIDYIEAHGTGTLLGDFIEAESIGTVYGAQRDVAKPLYVGSVKTNLGHLEWAAGVAGLLKAALVLRHGVIPPNQHFARPNPEIPWARWPIRVPQQRMSWPNPREARLAAVSSFGISGTNAHVVLESSPAATSGLPAADESEIARVYCFSGRDAAALTKVVERALEFLDQEPAATAADVSFTLAVGRAHFAERLAIRAPSLARLKVELGGVVAGKPSRMVSRGRVPASRRPVMAFLFPGQGVQYPGMAKRLYETERVFRRALEECAAVLRPCWELPLADLLWDEKCAPLLCETRYTQATLFAIEYALSRLWRAWGINPDYVVGHSLGEYAAACFAGVFTMEEGLRLLVRRGELMQALPAGGGMLAVAAGEEEMRPLVEKLQLEFAAINSPGAVTISGPVPALKALQAELAGRSIRCTALQVSHAFHSAAMEPMLESFSKALSTVALAPPKIPLIANLSGRRAQDELARPQYWLRQLRQPVRFLEGVEALRKTGCRIFVEVGPDSALLPLVAAIGGQDGALVPSLRRGKDDSAVIAQAVAELHVLGRSVDWVKFHEGRPGRKVALPAYPLERERFWVPEERLAAARAKQRNAHGLAARVVHPLLGVKLALAKQGIRAFVNTLRDSEVAFLADHRVDGHTLFPAAGYIEMALAAGRELFRTDRLVLRDMVIRQPLFVAEQNPPTLQLVLERSPGRNESVFSLYAQTGPEDDGGEPDLLCEGAVAVAEEATPAQTSSRPSLGPDERSITPAEFYARMADLGLEYGPYFQGIRRLKTGPGFAESTVQLLVEPGPGWYVHPAMLDAGFQTVAAVMDFNGNGHKALPIGLEYLCWHRRPTGPLICLATPSARAHDNGVRHADLRFIDSAGNEVGYARGLKLKLVEKATSNRSQVTAPAPSCHRIVWEPLSRPASRAALPDERLVIFVRDPDLEAALRQACAAENCQAIYVRPGRAFEQLSSDLLLANPAAPEDFSRALSNASVGDSDTGPRGVTVVYAWAVGGTTDGDAGDGRWGIGAEAGLLLMRALCETPDVVRLVTLTQGSQEIQPQFPVHDPCQAPLWGMARSLGLERPELESRRIDFDPTVSVCAQVPELLAEVRANDDERDVAYREGRRWGGRMEAVPSAATFDGRSDRFRIGITERGQLDRLIAQPIPAPELKPDEIEIMVLAAGLNFRDVLHALNLLPDTADQMPFGFEAAGVVTRIGRGVTRFAVGQEAVIGCTVGALGSHAVGREAFAVQKPQGLSFAQAAALPIAYLTAYYGLVRVGRLQKGERILIHAAAGGVGVAAVQLALRAGAEVYCTASPAKWEFLKGLGVRHISHSRNTDFAAEIESLLGARPLDVVLNSLSGEMIPKSLGLLRDGGRFIEIGKRGVWAVAEVAKVRPDVAYFLFDLSHVVESEPTLATHMLEEVVGGLRERSLSPLPITEFPHGRVAEAFRHLGQGRQIGKVVVTFPRPTAACVRQDGTYLIAGGLGGIGLKIAERLAQRGAGRLVLIGRRPPPPEVLPVLESLKALGTVVETYSVDASVRTQLEDLVRRINASGPPLRGVLHSAGKPNALLLSEQTVPNMREVMAAKADAALILHYATLDCPLDLFVSFSSISAVMPRAGQASYAAANAFLDSFASWRRKQGLAALTIAWGPWRDIGMMRHLPGEQVARMESGGVSLISTEDALDAFERVLPMQEAHVLVFTPDWPRVLAQPGQGAGGMWRKMRTAPATARLPLAESSWPRREAIRNRPRGERRPLFIAAVREEVGRILELADAERIPVDIDFAHLGMDSLMGTQLRSRLEKLAGRKLEGSFTREYPTIHAVVDFLETTVPEPSTPIAAEPAETGIPRADRSAGEFPLTAAQERMWIQHHLAPSPASYTEACAVRIPHNLQVDLFRQCLQEVVDREEALRVAFHERAGKVVQTLVPALALPWREVDLSANAPAIREASLKQLLAQIAACPMCLDRPPLFQATLVRLAPQELVLALAAHHSVVDGTSFRMLFNKVFRLYRSAERGEGTALVGRPVGFIDYAVWEANRRQAGVYAADVAFWKEYLTGLQGPTRLPADLTPAHDASKTAAWFQFEVEPTELRGLRALAQRESTTLFTVLFSAFQVLASRYLQSPEVTVGVPVTVRAAAEVEEMVGMFVNTVALRSVIAADTPLIATLRRTKRELQECFAHSAAPFQDVVSALNRSGAGEENPLFEVVFDFQSYSTKAMRQSGLEFEVIVIESAAAKFDLVWGFLEIDDTLSGRVQYRGDLYRSETIAGLARHYRAVLRTFLSDESKPVGQIALLDAAEQERSLLASRGAVRALPAGDSVAALVEAHAARQPEAVALVEGESRLTFAEWNARANALARVLVEAGVRPNDRVAVIADRSLFLCTALLGVMKAGAAYVPLDPATPANRLARVMEDAQPRLLLAGSEPAGLSKTAVPLLTANQLAGEISRQATNNLGLLVRPDESVYIVYTSGSTGLPKGVVVPHRGLLNLVAWHRNAFSVNPDDRSTLFASPGFDAAAWELWGNTAAGASVYITPPTAARDPSRLIAWIADQGITVCFLPTPIAELVLETPWPASKLRCLLTGGDRLRRRPHPGIPFAVFNNYGPTECSVVATSARVSPASGWDPLPSIGHPIDNLEVYLLDADGQLVPEGAVGELYLAGPGLATGYLNDPELTAERFTVRSIAGQAPRRTYRTGDRARRNADGELQFLGRADQQVKLRGFRIELAEIDRVLGNHASVAQAAAFLYESSAGDPSLGAAVVLKAGKTADLQGHCRQHLPAAMVPGCFEFLTELPLTANGKIDRQALAMTVRAGFRQPPATSRTGQVGESDERRLQAIFAQVLGLAEVPVSTSFFDLGGHSLLAVGLGARIRAEFGVDLAINEIFLHPTVEGLLGRLSCGKTSATRSGPLPERLISISGGASGTPLYLICPASGSPLCYLELAEALAIPNPIFGLQAPGLLDGEPPAATVEAMADDFRSLILQHSTSGRVLLAGWSYGGLVAYELGRRFAAEGRTVKVAVLDAEVLNRANVAPSVSMVNLAAGGLREAARNLWSLGLPTTYDRVRRLARWVGVSLPPSLKGFRLERQFGTHLATTAYRSARLFVVNYRAGRTYVLRSSEADVTLLKTQLGSEEHSPIVQALKVVCARPLRVIEIPGNHMTLFEQPHLPVLAAELRRIFQ